MALAYQRHRSSRSLELAQYKTRWWRKLPQMDPPGCPDTRRGGEAPSTARQPISAARPAICSGVWLKRRAVAAGMISRR